MNSPAHRHRARRRLIIGSIFVIGLLLVVGVIFLVAVHQQVQANTTVVISFADIEDRPQVEEFEGFINYGTPIQETSATASGIPVTLVLTESRIEHPIFVSATFDARMKFWWREWTRAAEEVLQNVLSAE